MENQDKQKGEANRVSYWENAVKDFDLKVPSKVPKQQRIDLCQRKIVTIKNDSGQLKYPQLFSLANCLFSISHGNSVPEKGFSINKHLLDIHGNSTKDDTIVALRTVEDH